MSAERTARQGSAARAAAARAAAAVRAEPLTVGRLLAARAAADPDRIAITQGSATLSTAAWHQRSLRVAAALRQEGVMPGDRIGLVFSGQQWIDYAVAYTAVLAAGAVAVPMSDRSAPAEIEHMLRHCAATMVLHGPGVRLPPVPARTAPIDRYDTADWYDTADRYDTAGPVDLPPGHPTDLAQIIYTSGTTGQPKGVAASQANVTHGCLLKPMLRRLAHSTHFLHAFPIGTNAGQNMLFNALDAHAGMLVTARFTPAHFGRLIAQHGVGTVFVVPAMAIELLQERVAAEHDLSSVVLFGSTAAALPPSVALELTRALPGATVANYYTSTEAAPAQTTMIFNPARPASLGRAAAGRDLRIAASGGAAAGPGEVGEVWLRSPSIPRSYYGDPDATAQVFRDGWTRMGDLGYLDDEGYLYLVDRVSDVIKSGAYKVSTLQIEAALHAHPDITEAAVVGIAHPVLGMTPAAVLVCARPVTAPALRAFLAGHLAPHELPTRLLQLDALPRNTAGKVLKRELPALFAGDDTDRRQR